MNIEKELINELSQTEFRNPDSLEEIQSKDGLYVYRIYKGLTPYVIKYIKKEEYKREIDMYRLLIDLDIKTLNIFELTDNLIVMEDICNSENYRLGTEEDLSDNDVAKSLAIWYKDFHNKGIMYLKENKNTKLYKEIDKITLESIKNIMIKSNNTNNPILISLIENLDRIQDMLRNMTQTLNYNDFYYTNLIVSKDRKEAFMFDFNFMGEGLRYFDIRNVTSSLKGGAKQTFLLDYGEYEIKEKVIDDVFSVIFDLSTAYEKERFPKWGEESLDKIKNGTFENNVKLLIHSLED